MNNLAVMTAGSVDDGKSTLLGRLLYDTNNLTTDQSEYLTELNNKFKKKDVKLDYSLLLDGLVSEKEQGITIDVAFKYFVIGDTQFTIIDTPGHFEYTKNMAYAATFADICLLLIDSSNKSTEQTFRHLDIVSLFPNIKKVIVCINKLDKVNYSKDLYFEIVKQISDYSDKNGYASPTFIPISAVDGVNIIEKSNKTKFYKGPSLIEELISLQLNQKRNNRKISYVRGLNLNFSERLYYLENNGLKITKGMNLYNLESGESSSVKKIYENFREVESSNDSQITVSFNKNISIAKNDILVSDKFFKKASGFTNSFKAKVIWCSKSELVRSKDYVFK